MKTYHLKWDSHIPNMEMVFTTLFESEGLADVTIMCKEGSLKAHRLILSTCSNYFLRLFLNINTKRPVISLPEVEYSVAKSLLSFIYTGEVQITEYKLEELLEVAEMLEIQGLTEGKKSSSNVVQDLASKTEERFNSPKKEELTLSIVNVFQSSVKPELGDKDLQQDDYIKEDFDAQAPDSKNYHMQSMEESGFETMQHATDGNDDISVTEDEDEKLEQGEEQQQRTDEGSYVPENSNVSDLSIIAPSPYSNQPSMNSGLSLYNNQQIIQPQQQHPNSSYLQQEDINKIMSQVSFPSCPICAKDCANLPNLRTHLQTHLQGKPFTCEFCEAKFSRASHLCRHRRTHTGEKPFACKKCGKSFSRQDKLKNHMDRHLAEETGITHRIKGKPGRKSTKQQPQSKPELQQSQEERKDPILPQNPVRFHQEHQQQQQNIPATMNSRTWSNVAFPGFSNPFYTTSAMQQQQPNGQHHQELPPLSVAAVAAAAAARFQPNLMAQQPQMWGGAGNAIMSSLMKMGECSIQQVPK